MFIQCIDRRVSPKVCARQILQGANKLNRQRSTFNVSLRFHTDVENNDFSADRSDNSWYTFLCYEIKVSHVQGTGRDLEHGRLRMDVVGVVDVDDCAFCRAVRCDCEIFMVRWAPSTCGNREN